MTRAAHQLSRAERTADEEDVTKKTIPWDQRVARLLVQPLARTPLTANHVTGFTLVLSLVGAGLFVPGDHAMQSWGAGLFVLARFLDHFDGELARLKGGGSRFGYYFDYVTGAAGYGALFLCMGIGFANGPLDDWALLLGAAGTSAAIIAMALNLQIDVARGEGSDGDAVGYPGFAGFELEDGMYLLAPITWVGLLQPFFVAAGVGAVIYCIWTLVSLMRLRARNRERVRP